MPNDYEICKILQAQYDGAQGVFDILAPYGVVSWALKHYDDCDVLCFEGSHDIPDFERDFKAEIIPVRGLGAVHGGFYEGLPGVLQDVMPSISTEKLLKICGHSLGGGEAHIFTGLAVNAGFTKIECITFGSPLPGDQQLANLISPFPNRSYWNYMDDFHHDIVGDVPRHLPIIEPYVFPSKRILINEEPDFPDPWLLASWHHSQLYIRGLQKICATSNAT